jgi:hypothetical protein
MEAGEFFLNPLSRNQYLYEPEARNQYHILKSSSRCGPKKFCENSSV